MNIFRWGKARVGQTYPLEGVSRDASGDCRWLYELGVFGYELMVELLLLLGPIRTARTSDGM